MTTNNTKKEEQDKMYQAVYTLEGELSLLMDDLIKTRIMMEEVTGDFFMKYNENTNDGLLSITWEFEIFKAKANIAFDYSISMGKKVQDLLDVLDAKKDN